MRYNFSNSKFKIDIYNITSEEIFDIIYENIDELSLGPKLKRMDDEKLFKTIDNILEQILTTTLSGNPTLIALFRGVVLENEEPNLDNPGICWTETEEKAIEFVEDFLMEELPDLKGYILDFVYKVEDIDWISTICARIEEPNEQEVRIFKEAIPVGESSFYEY